ncbi:MAG: hypothetical protein V4529_16765 [Gemmatimonadota bacterium]
MSAPRETQLDLRFRVPSVRSATSEDAADELERAGKAKRERRRCLIWFASQSEPRTRHELADALYQQTGGIGSACGRCAEVISLGWLEEIGRKEKRATISITDRGRQMARLLTRAA